MQLRLLSEFDNRADKVYNTPLEARAGLDYGAHGLLSLGQTKMTNPDGSIRHPFAMVVDVKYPVRIFRYIIPFRGRSFYKTLAIVKKMLNNPVSLVRYLDAQAFDRAELQKKHHGK